jgi:hypothetical protein
MKSLEKIVGAAKNFGRAALIGGSLAIGCITGCVDEPDDYEPIDVAAETWSSGLEALEIDNTRGKREAAIAVNAQAEPLIVYQDSESGFSCAEVQGGSWVKSTVDPANGHDMYGMGENPNRSGEYNSVVIAPNGIAHVAYSMDIWYRGEDLYYANNSGDPWDSYNIDGSLSVGLENSIALDSRGNVHISYWSWERSALKYISNDSGDWVVESISPAGWDKTSIALDSQDSVHIAFMINEGTYHITNASGSWDRTSIHSSANPSLLIDSGDILHIFSNGEHAIYHSTNQSGSWTTNEIINHHPDYLPRELNLSGAIAEDDSILISYLVSPTTPDYPSVGMLYFATNKDGSWKKFLLDDTEGYIHPSIAVDNEGNAHISVVRSLAQDNNIVKYVKFNPQLLLDNN